MIHLGRQWINPESRLGISLGTGISRDQIFGSGSGPGYPNPGISGTGPGSRACLHSIPRDKAKLGLGLFCQLGTTHLAGILP